MCYPRRMIESRFPDPVEREKRRRINEMLDVGKTMLYVDPRNDGVDLPAHLMNEVAVPLNLSRAFGLDVFEVGPLDIRASLSFGGTRHLCVLPYRAIFGALNHVDGTRLVFPDALPPEVSVTATEQDAAGADAEADTPLAETDKAAAEHAAAPSEPPPSRPHLRLVD